MISINIFQRRIFILSHFIEFNILNTIIEMTISTFAVTFKFVVINYTHKINFTLMKKKLDIAQQSKLLIGLIE